MMSGSSDISHAATAIRGERASRKSLRGRASCDLERTAVVRRGDAVKWYGEVGRAQVHPLFAIRLDLVGLAAYRHCA
jgi:hypothetical protein